MYVLMYVDDLIVVHESDDTIVKFAKLMNKHFTMNDLGDVSHYLGIQIEREADGSFLLQSKYKNCSYS